MHSIKPLPECTAWLDDLTDEPVRGVIVARIKRLALGLMGDVEPAGVGVSELRIHEDLPGCPARKSGEEWQPVAKRRREPSWFTKAPPGRAGLFTAELITLRGAAKQILVCMARPFEYHDT